MRYKGHTINKLEGQVSKLKTLQRQIEMGSISGPDALRQLDSVIKELTNIIERLDLEPNE